MSNDTFQNLPQSQRNSIEAAAFRRLLQHLEQRTDVQNIDLMNLSGFCRNCLSKWLSTASQAQQVDLSVDEAKTYVYGMDYQDWKNQYQTPLQ